MITNDKNNLSKKNKKDHSNNTTLHRERQTETYLVVRGEHINKTKFHYKSSNKHLCSINKLSTNKKAQNHCYFLINYNVIIYEN